MTNLYYDLPNDILWIIDNICHNLNMNDIVYELKNKVTVHNEKSSKNCFLKLRAFCEILYYEENLSDLKQMVKEQPRCPILKNSIDCAEGGLAWLYDYYDMQRV